LERCASESKVQTRDDPLTMHDEVFYGESLISLKLIRQEIEVSTHRYPQGVCRFFGEQFFSQGWVDTRAAGLTYLRNFSPWYDPISFISFRTRSFRSSPRLYLTLTFYHWQLAFLQLKSYMTAVPLMAPPHNGLDTPWLKSMLDSLSYSRTFPRIPRWKDPPLLHVFCIYSWVTFLPGNLTHARW